MYRKQLHWNRLPFYLRDLLDDLDTFQTEKICVYAARVTQNGTSTPEVNIIQDTILGDKQIFRIAPGLYWLKIKSAQADQIAPMLSHNVIVDYAAGDVKYVDLFVQQFGKDVIIHLDTWGDVGNGLEPIDGVMELNPPTLMVFQFPHTA